MDFKTVHEQVHDVPFIDDENARFLYDLIVKEGLRNILELGIAHGTATCYMETLNGPYRPKYRPRPTQGVFDMIQLTIRLGDVKPSLAQRLPQRVDIRK